LNILSRVMALALLAPCGAHAQAPTTYLAGLQLRENTQLYDIAAKNSGDIAKALRDHGVISAIESGYRSGYVWQLSWKLTPQPSTAGCTVKDMAVTLTSITSLPRWTAPPKTPAALSADWSRFDTNLRAHLAKQRNLAVNKAQQLKGRVAKLQASTCDVLQRGVDFLGQQWIEDMHKADDDFARATRHGETGGVAWPPPKAAAPPAPKPRA
jgi:predicted secreted Zn-dependent protease